MQLYKRQDEFVRAAQWTNPMEIPPAPRELLILKNGTWFLRAYEGSETMTPVMPPPCWILEYPDGLHSSRDDLDFRANYELVTDKTIEVHHEWAVLAHRMIQGLSIVTGVMNNAEGPDRVRMLVNRLRAAETKAVMWDTIPSVAARLGIDCTELLRAVKDRVSRREDV